MLVYFETTTLILLWCLVLAGAWGFAVYAWTWRHAFVPARDRLVVRFTDWTLPALVVAPLALVLAFRGIGVNLIFPVQLLVGFGDMMRAALAPAVVLVLSSGLATSIKRQIEAESVFWSGKAFVRMTRAVGGDPASALQRLVLGKALVGSAARCLPWLFGELIIVESVFNAPGLGLGAWHSARTRDFAGLGEAIAWLAGLYGCCVVASAFVNRRIGRRLESYA